MGAKGFAIYDRNYDHPLPQYAFPPQVAPCILGSLKPDEIDVAYKGYNYGVNMNTVSQTQTMFARRVFEMLASNTVVVGNYSRGLKNYFGDLTISTDDAGTLTGTLDKYCKDDSARRNYRLQGLRKVLMGHLYEDRLTFIARKLFTNEFERKSDAITVIAFADDGAQAERVMEMFRRQSYADKRLVLVGNGAARDFSGQSLPEYGLGQSPPGYGQGQPPPVSGSEGGAALISAEKAKNVALGELAKDGFVTVFAASDFYGENYLLDLALTTRYGKFDAIGKARYYSMADASDGDAPCIDGIGGIGGIGGVAGAGGAFGISRGAGAFGISRGAVGAGAANPDAGSGRLTLSGGEAYKSAASLTLRRAMARAELLAGETLSDCAADRELSFGNMFSIDEFNYCMDCPADCRQVADMDIADRGVSLETLNAAVSKIRPRGVDEFTKAIWADELAEGLQLRDRKSVRVTLAQRRALIESRLAADEYQYCYMRGLYGVDPFEEDGMLPIAAYGMGDLNLLGICVFLDGEGSPLERESFKPNCVKGCAVPEGARYLRLGFRVQGAGAAHIGKIVIGGRDALGTGRLLANAGLLVLTDKYPSASQPTLNLKLHRKLLEYKAAGLVFDVMRVNACSAGGRYREYEGVNVIEGDVAELAHVLDNGNVETVIAYGMGEPAWEAIKPRLGAFKLMAPGSGDAAAPPFGVGAAAGSLAENETMNVPIFEYGGREYGG
jgi:hypothetical protein